MTAQESYTLATQIVQRLAIAGYRAYFAGGWVRDYLLGHPSQDIDIATDAPPQVILDLFPRTIHVGIAFGVVIVAVDGHQFEVATFRKDLVYTNGRKPDQIEMSSPEEDAKRRDFTINGMFYDPLTDQIYDYVGGMHDLQKGIVCAIGDPFERFREDRLRMIRAVRFAMRFEFIIDYNTEAAIKEYSVSLLPAVAIERIWHELIKMAQKKNFDGAIITLHRLELLGVIFPKLASVHLSTIKEYVAHYHAYPVETPTILYVLQLFPNASLDEMFDLSAYLKLSNEDKKVIMAWMDLKQLCALEHETMNHSDYFWVHYYAGPLSSLCLEVYAKNLDRPQVFLELHAKRRERLAAHIDRIVQKKPLVTSQHLQAEGIPCGILLGQLMRRAEEIAIDEDHSSPTAVIEELKQSAIWPKS